MKTFTGIKLSPVQQGIGAALFIAASALISHFALIIPQARPLAAAIAVAVPAFALSWFVYHALLKLGVQPLLGILMAVACVSLPLFWAWPWVLANPDALYFVQHIGTNAALAWVFGRTLVAERTPLVVVFARMVHKVLPPEIERYAKQVTFAWVLFFLLTCATSIVLFFAAPLAVWSSFAVLLQWPTVAAFFVGEYILRKMLFRQFEHATLKQGFDAYRQSQGQSQNTARKAIE